MKALWKKMSPWGRAGFLMGLAALAATIVAAARCDLAGRDPAEVRGNRGVWDKVTRMPGGATAYLIAGRRSA